MKVFRTPDEAFDGLPDYNFAPNYCQVNGDELGPLRLHYVDEGNKDDLAVIMLHGEPSWSYLYRKMITQVSSAGYRVIAPDLIGFGRSDKPADMSDYSYSNHVTWMSEWLASLNLKQTVLFCQDWGGLIGLRLVAKTPNLFAGVVAANTFLPTGKGQMPEAFTKWQEFSKSVPEFPVGGIIRGATVKDLGEGVEAAYDAPYLEESYKAGARIFPSLVPTTPEMDGAKENVKAWETLSQWQKPFLTCFSDQDPVTAGMDKIFQKLIPGCAGQQHQFLKGGGHFLQEDLPDELSQIIVNFCKGLT